jgi:predicted Zn-dependent peptidase
MVEAFSPESILVAAAGNVEHQTFLDLIGPELEAIPYQGKPVLREPPKNGRVLQVIPKDLEQVHICLGMDGCSLLDESRFACHLLNVVLGSSMSSRLLQEIRERRGLAYSVFSFLNSYQDAGILGVYAGVGPGQVTETLEAIMEMLQELAVKSISEPELQAAREYIRGNMYLGAESTDSRMNRLAKNELLFNRLIPFEEIEDRLNQVAAEDIREWLSEVFQPDKLSMLLLGPTEWGEVEKVRR